MSENIHQQLHQLSSLLNKKISIQLNAKRQISGVLSSFDKFMNLCLINVVEHVRINQKDVKEGNNGLTWKFVNLDGAIIIRGNCIERIEVLSNES